MEEIYKLISNERKSRFFSSMRHASFESSVRAHCELIRSMEFVGFVGFVKFVGFVASQCK